MAKHLLKTINLSIFIFLLTKSLISSDIPVGQLVDFTGPTSSVGRPFGQGHIDVIKWINKNDGIKNKKIRLETVD